MLPRFFVNYMSIYSSNKFKFFFIFNSNLSLFFLFNLKKIILKFFPKSFFIKDKLKLPKFSSFRLLNRCGFLKFFFNN